MSVVSYPTRNPKYGNPKYPGNTPGELYLEIIPFLDRAIGPVQKVVSLFGGSGTVYDVCQELGRECVSFDLRKEETPRPGEHFEVDVLNIELDEAGGAQLIESHAPYHHMIRYSRDPRDLSQCQSYEEFLKKLNLVHARAYSALEMGGCLMVIQGLWRHKGVLRSIADDLARFGTLIGKVIKIQHNCRSDSKRYMSNNFIPTVHEEVLLMKKTDKYNWGLRIVQFVNWDVRQSSVVPSWRDAIRDALSELGRQASLKNLYEKVSELYPIKVKKNSNWQAKIRERLQTCSEFSSTERGVWEVA